MNGMRRGYFSTAIILALATLGGGCAAPPAAAPAPPEPVVTPVAVSGYPALVERLRAHDLDIDFTELRLLLTQSDGYAPYGAREYSDTIALFRAMEGEDNAACLDITDRILAYNYTSLYAHYAAVACHRRVGDVDAESFHNTVLARLMGSIADSGDGQSAETAYVIISTIELQAFLELNGFPIVERSLVHTDAGIYDRIATSDPEFGDRLEFWFDVGIPLGATSPEHPN